MNDLPDPGSPEVDERVLSFLETLKQCEFKGELGSDLANRLACSTDNSIYQIIPQAVVYPKDGEDLVLLMRVAQNPEYQHLKIYPRGGGTSTNGQSLGDGIVVDTSRHMRRVVDFDDETGLVKVEPGLVRDKLIEFLEPYGRFFAPHVSTTSRATLGGMASNDSSGKGSVVYGKTSDHVESIELVLPSGEVVEIGRVDQHNVADLSGAIGNIARTIDHILAPHADDIRDRFPEMKRGFTGYNLKEAREENGDLNLAKLVAGSEGTLGLIKSITLRTERIPKYTVLAVLVYPSHQAGLRAIPGLLDFYPIAIEFIDDKILGAALNSPFADDVKDVLGIQSSDDSLAAHFFEMSENDEDVLKRRLLLFLEHQKNLSDETLRPISFKVIRESDQIARAWEIRKACQGLLAGFDRNRRAVAFIEDCAVPPEKLADFVAELEVLLTAKNIRLGMYGHADVGCVHIRPLMNLAYEEERRQIREISDAVFKLTQKYGGLLWGEHGKGLRGEYSERVIGPELYRVMRKVKGVFDPSDRMNPGKIARPDSADSQLIALDGAAMRGEFDEQVTPVLRESYANVLRCDGNGSCYNQDDALPFCPSYKATGDRRLSPKGRSSLLREWVRARSLGDEGGTQKIADDLHDILDTCLACKACVGAGCPARVDIPQLKSQFLDWYYKNEKRPIADHLVSNLERMAPILDRLGGNLFNRLQSTHFIQKVMKQSFGFVNLPELRSRRDFLQRVQSIGARTLSATSLLQFSEVEKESTIIIVQDCFTSFYDSDVLLAQIELVQSLGFKPVLLQYREGGKPLHVRGFLDRFRQVAERNARELAALDQAGLTLLGVDNATTLMYRHEYKEALHDCPSFRVLLLSEWLKTVNLPKLQSNQEYTLIQHCTERSLTPETSAQWVGIFKQVGLNVRIFKTGCCGMSGLFGHEESHQDISTTLYGQNWRELAESPIGRDNRLIATGYSCRSQVKRFSNIKALHPAEVLVNNWWT